MTCKCDISKINLKDEKFELNIDLLKFQNLDVRTSFLGLAYDEEALNLGDNIYIWGGSNLIASPSDTKSQVLESLNTVKANMTCACLKSKLDLVKIIVGDSKDDRLFAPGRAHGFVNRISPFIMINEITVQQSDDWRYHVILHEFTHSIDPDIGCAACADPMKRLIFNRTRSQLFYIYIYIYYYDIKNFHREFIKSLIDNKQINPKDPPQDLSDLIKEDYLWHLKYAASNKHEFYAQMVPLFCDNYYRGETSLLNGKYFFYPDNSISIPSSKIWDLYITAFNKRYKNFIENFCSLHRSITDDCNKDAKSETFKPYIKCSSVFGSFGCCESFKVSFSKYDTDCCKPSNTNPMETSNISVGDIILQNKCKCHYVFKPEIDIVDLLLIMQNCRRIFPLKALGTGYYDTNTENFKIFKEDIIEKIYQYLKNLIENNSDSKLFLDEIPCD